MVVVFCHLHSGVVVTASEHNSLASRREVGNWVSRRVTEAATIWASGSMGQCYVPPFGRPAPAAGLACTSKWHLASVLFPQNLLPRHPGTPPNHLHLLPTCNLSSITHPRLNGTTHLGSWAGTGRGSNRGWCTLQKQRLDAASLFQNIWNMHPLPRNPHVAFHIPNLGVTPQPPLHCLTLLDLLPHLALGLASGQRNNRCRMNQSEGEKKLLDGRATQRDVKQTLVSPHNTHHHHQLGQASAARAAQSWIHPRTSIPLQTPRPAIRLHEPHSKSGHFAS